MAKRKLAVCLLGLAGASAFGPSRHVSSRTSSRQRFSVARQYAPEENAAAAAASATTSSTPSLEKLKWEPSGTLSWDFESSEGTHTINYVAEGIDKPGTPLVLIHGFGASSFHWRYNVPALAKERPVYAFDLLGFGLSDKPLVGYSAEIWRDQAGKFLEEVVGCSGAPGGKKAAVAGNSLGGFSALYCAAEYPDLVSGCVMLNGAGRFKPTDPEAAAAEAARAAVAAAGRDEQEGLVDKLKAFLTKGVIYGSFFVTKQPARIEQVLRQVYPIDNSNVDAELVESIRFPADTSPNCAEVFFRVITKNGSGPATAYIDDLLPKLTAAKIPLSLVWGESDPWIRPAAADKIQSLKPDTQRVSIDAGHCPHDEAPEAVNAALSAFMAGIDA